MLGGLGTCQVEEYRHGVRGEFYSFARSSFSYLRYVSGGVKGILRGGGVYDMRIMKG